MSPAARYFELPILFHERMIGLIAVCHQSSLVSFQVLLQDGTISTSQVFIQKDRGRSRSFRRMKYPHIFLGMLRHNEWSFITMHVMGLKKFSLHHLMHRLQIVISKTNHPTGHVLSGNIYIITKEFF